MFAVLKTPTVAVLALAAGLGLVAEARPNGSTVCVISPELMDRMAKNGAMGPMNTQLAIRVNATAAYTPGSAPMEITVTSAAPMQGILLYAENGAGAHVGSFTAPAGFKAINIPACKNEGPTSSLTHAAPAPKGATMKFSWTPPKAGQGPLTIKALVTTDNTSGFNQGLARLTGPGTPTAIEGGDAAAPAAGGAAGAAGGRTGAAGGAAGAAGSGSAAISASVAAIAAGVVGAVAANF